MKHEFIENNIIILSKQTIDAFLDEEKPSDLIALYCFYYYTAKWQKTNQPKATTSYVENGLKWTKERVQINKKQLIKLGLINDIVKKSKEGKIIGWYIKLNYLWKNETIKNHQQEKPASGKSYPVENPTTNALSDNNINALNVDNIIKQKTKKFIFLVENTCNDIEKEKNIKFTKQHKEIIQDFILYWTEPTKSEKQIKYDKESTWDTKRRLRTWFKNANKFSGNSNNKYKIKKI